MRKAYSKPQIMFEDFTLSTNIAAGCEYKNGVLPSSGKHGCGLLMGPMVVFVDALCDVSVGVSDGERDGICYDVPFGDNNIFAS